MRAANTGESSFYNTHKQKLWIPVLELIIDKFLDPGFPLTHPRQLPTASWTGFRCVQYYTKGKHWLTVPYSGDTVIRKPSGWMIGNWLNTLNTLNSLI